MTQDQRNKIGFIWASIARIYGKELEKNTLKIMIDSVEDLQFEKIISSLNNWPKTSKLNRHPFPAELRELIIPEINERSVAIVLARKIDKAIRDHGSMWDQGIMGFNGIFFEGGGKIFPTWKEAVIEELGQIGWATIVQKGGWLQTRNSANEMDEQGFIAQTRDQIQANIQLEKQGVDLRLLEMPKPKSFLGIPSLSDKNTLNFIETKRMENEWQT